MKRTFFLKIFGGYLLLIAAFSILFFVLSVGIIKSFYLDTLAHDLTKLGHTLKLNIFPLLEENRHKELDRLVKDLRETINTRITVVDRNGVVLADSDEDPKLMKNHKFRPEIAAALKGEPGRSLRFSNTVRADMLYVGLPIRRGGRVSEVLRVSLYVEDINRLFSRLRTSIVRVGLAFILVSFLAALLFSRSLSQPIELMKQASRRMAAGDLSTKVSLKSRGELQDLARSLNAMAERIERTFEDLKSQKQKLSSILSSIEEGLLAADSEGKVLFANAVFRKIIGVEHPEGKFTWEVLRDRTFNELLQKARDEKADVSREISLGERSFSCRVNYLCPTGEMVLSLRDVTELKRVEKMKKDFIANVSHELRTPLTAIRGFIETLEAEVHGPALKYAKIIERHADRISRIVEDLLHLSELESLEGREALEVSERVDLPKMIEDVVAIYRQKLEKKNIQVEINAAAGLPPLRGDPFKLEQMFLNLIDNAVKHTEKGKIRISMEMKNNRVAVEIQDTGIGIPEEHLPRVFERFYVVDKSRSRKLGGTGLGLSIVKHIALLHGGAVSVRSRVGEGTAFTVYLPV